MCITPEGADGVRTGRLPGNLVPGRHHPGESLGRRLLVIPIIDVFAGPGGFHEGFSALVDESGRPVFETVASVEMEPSAHATLTLRAAYWHLARAGRVPESYYEYIRGEITWEAFSALPDIAPVLKAASAKVHMLELGPDTRTESDRIIAKALKGRGDRWALVGGPPCQAYSTVGRARRRGDEDFESDKKHFLYKEYLHIIATFRPAIFVMENVTGMLSSQHGGTGIFVRILNDLKNPHADDEYEIRSFVTAGDATFLKPADFVIRAEKFGIPQNRHRVILFGVRKDIGWGEALGMLAPTETVTVREAIGGLPKIRSEMNPPSSDSWDGWLELREQGRTHLEAALDQRVPTTRIERLTTGSIFVSRENSIDADSADSTLGDEIKPTEAATSALSDYQSWVTDERVGGAVQHQARRHMHSDLTRYHFLSAFADACDRSPKLDDLPPALAPAHKNIGTATTPFTDRFRVQRWESPSTTVVAHIAKDGHYYIHPDADQMRSLTVREVARLQTFPDNFFFCGSRSQQYVQIGNAVPPLLAHKVAGLVAEAFAGLTVAAELPTPDGLVDPARGIGPIVPDALLTDAQLTDTAA
jgi:DNA (cytosine-5)-methyltransferase 1